MEGQYDFQGWATKYGIKCSDGRTILPNAFKDSDGMIVPVVWNHQHQEIQHVLGKALLESRPEGIYAYGTFNNTDNGVVARELVKDGDIKSLSICAKPIRQQAAAVVHGVIRELSLVLAGANPGAHIETSLAHSDDGDFEEAYIWHGEEMSLIHSDTNEGAQEKEKEDMPNEKKPSEIFETLNEEQKTLVYALIDQATNSNDDEDDDDEEEEESMKHNVFDEMSGPKDEVLTHSDQISIIKSAKASSVGTLKAAIANHLGDGAELVHGIESIETLFPEHQLVRPGAPELITTDQGWIGRVLAKVHKSPISRIRTRQADVRDISDRRARGYVKGTLKMEGGDIRLLTRTTDSQTVYVRSKLDRDDVVDIVDFDVVQYLYKIDRMSLNEELARAIMIGDGRDDMDPDKIHPDKIRPVWTDHELYTIRVDVDIEGMRESLQGMYTDAYFGDNYIYAESVIQSLLYAREDYRGSASPDFFCTPRLLNIMLLSRDRNGRRVYDNVNELRSALNVNEIITAEQFEGQIRVTADNKRKKLLGIMYNLSDYALGSTKGGEVSHFTDFDIDFNQMKSMIEVRLSGANTRVLSAIVLEEDVTNAQG